MSDKYHLSSGLAIEELRKKDPAEVARLSGGSFNALDKALTISFCGRPVVFSYEDFSLKWGDTGADFEKPGDIPILHYLSNADGTEPTGEFLPYRDLWGANVQSGPFIARPETILAEKYDAAPAEVMAAGRRLGAEGIGKYGDVRLDIPALPKVRVALLLYAADDDLPAGAKFLFDSAIKNYLPTEDVIWLAGWLAERMTA